MTFFPSQVILNVYDLTPINDWGHPVGLGAFHSGLVVDDREYTFAGGGGIFNHDPRKGDTSIVGYTRCLVRVTNRLGDGRCFGTKNASYSPAGKEDGGSFFKRRGVGFWSFGAGLWSKNSSRGKGSGQSQTLNRLHIS